eukprot:CAMPEP_0172894204 /NCGR_PEP_ID=MMETSP1075-20121228/150338_1 /TAXON_ID=2916 /ORGANISM="Ceratium fusus, Strain PA161109" /LENGTH=542 /DNA_ID=CAMNT_0013749189 /DNA_START=1 /DNA_END=1626 /DNA_ORIENTATION=-
MEHGRSWLGRLGDSYNMLWKMVIRPPRDLYSLEELGPAKFRLGKRVYERRDLQLRSSRGVLECSHFHPAKALQVPRPCVVYLHGNCSSRLEAFDALPVLLPRDLTVFCLDLSGSGRSGGEYISLGYHEEQDLKIVLQHLRSLDTVSSIALWGRSMGATTSILRAAEDHALAACVLDSAFRDLRTVAEELVNRGKYPVPQFILSWALHMIRSEVSTRAAFDPLELMPIESAPRAVCPAFFGVAADDTFVLPHHTQDLHNAWAGERTLRVFDGGHNGVRPSWFLEEAAEFLVDRMRTRSIFKEDATPGRRFAASSGAGDIEEDDIVDGDGKQTPRLVSPLTNGLRIDADSAAGQALIHDEVAGIIGHRQQLAIALMQMGFGQAAAAQATQHGRTVDDCLEWLLKQPDGRIEPGRAGMCNARKVGVQQTGQGSSGRASSAPKQSQHSQTRMEVASSQPRQSATAGGNLSEQLQFLGFAENHADLASKRCLTIDAAMEFMAQQQVLSTFEACCVTAAIEAAAVVAESSPSAGAAVAAAALVMPALV